MLRRYGRRPIVFTALVLSAAGAGVALADTVVYGYTYTPPQPATGSPQILKVELNSDSLHAGGVIAIRVSTTPDVVTVVTGNGKRAGSIPQTAPGVFTTESTLPRLGGIKTIHIKLHFKATNAAGTSTDLDVPVAYK